MGVFNVHFSYNAHAKGSLGIFLAMVALCGLITVTATHYNSKSDKILRYFETSNPCIFLDHYPATAVGIVLVTGSVLPLAALMLILCVCVHAVDPNDVPHNRLRFHHDHAPLRQRRLLHDHVWVCHDFPLSSPLLQRHQRVLHQPLSRHIPRGNTVRVLREGMRYSTTPRLSATLLDLSSRNRVTKLAPFSPRSWEPCSCTDSSMLHGKRDRTLTELESCKATSEASAQEPVMCDVCCRLCGEIFWMVFMVRMWKLVTDTRMTKAQVFPWYFSPLSFFTSSLVCIHHVCVVRWMYLLFAFLCVGLCFAALLMLAV